MKTDDLPESPGVYIFLDDKGKNLYVGKAINLKNRVSSYFAAIESLTPKTRALVGKIEKIDYVKTENEVEALLLEAELIKRYKPPYNISMKDDKYYKFIKIEKNKLEVLDSKNLIQTDVLKVSTSRKKNTKNTIYLGPYPDGASVNIILRSLRKIFPYRDCSNQKFNRYRKTKRPCLYGHIGLCTAPCQGLKEVEENNKNINLVKEYIKGDRKKLINDLNKEMKIYSKNHEYEKAAVIRDQLNSFEYLSQNVRDIKEYIDIPSLVDDKNIEAQNSLINYLKENTKFKFKDTDESRIELYDISNIQGKNPVGSMVVITNGTEDKKNYRKFKINTKDSPDDFAMMQEMLKRRFSNKNKSNWNLPNLIVIDGGKGQLSSALEVLDDLDVNIPTIGLAKKYETIVTFEGDKFTELNLPANSEAINLLKKGRDEAHRFAITFHRKLRKKQIYS